MIEPLPKSLEPKDTDIVIALGHEWYIGFDREPVHDRLNSPYYYDAVSLLLGGDWYALADVFSEEICALIQAEYDKGPV